MATNQEPENPWIALKPPTTDPMTYLVFVEHNLSMESLPHLEDALSDQQLTQDIGWDLVMPLLPLIPHSQKCLVHIAQNGNPREVLLKVTEALRLLELDGMEEPSEAISDDGEGQDTVAGADAGAAGSSGLKQQPDIAPELELPIPVRQFQVLIQMLAILYPRITTKQPYRFLSATLQAILVAFGKATQCHAEMAQEIVALVKTLSGTKRPHLPRRGSSSNVLTKVASGSAPDPEGQGETPEDDDDAAIQQRLMQSVLTHVLEDYMLSLHSAEDVPGMAWSSRLEEKLHPQRQIPGRQTYADRFANQDKLQHRIATVGEIVALTQDLDLNSHDLFEAIMDTAPEPVGRAAEDEPPDTPKDIPLSKTGSLFLLCARKAIEALYDRSTTTPPIDIFPEHATILKNFIGGPSQPAIGLQSESLVDALLFLGLLALEGDDVGRIPADEAFNEYLQSTSLLAANCVSPTLRFHAHFLTTTILRSHPHDLVRFSYIADTLEHCPYANLKAAAVGWLKSETLEANPAPDAAAAAKGAEASTGSAEAQGDPAPQRKGDTSAGAAGKNDDDDDDDDEHTHDHVTSIFATPIALSKLSPHLFPDLTLDYAPAAHATPDAFALFQENLSFHLAALNFLYLLLSARHLHEPLQVPDLVATSDLGPSFLAPLRDAVALFGRELGDGGELPGGGGAAAAGGGDEALQRARTDLALLEYAVGRCEEGIKQL